MVTYVLLRLVKKIWFIGVVAITIVSFEGKGQEKWIGLQIPRHGLHY
jgi:hypothetical protein